MGESKFAKLFKEVCKPVEITVDPLKDNPNIPRPIEGTLSPSSAPKHMVGLFGDIGANHLE